MGENALKISIADAGDALNDNVADADLADATNVVATLPSTVTQTWGPAEIRDNARAHFGNIHGNVYS